VRFEDATPDGLPSLSLVVGAVTLEEAGIGRALPGGPLNWSLASANASGWRLGVAPGEGEEYEADVVASTGSLRPDGTIPLALEVRREGGLSIEVEGALRPSPLELGLDLRWRDLSSRALAGPEAILGAFVVRGVSEAELRLDLKLGDVAERGLALGGSLIHHDLQLELADLPDARLSVARATGEIERIFVPIPAAPSGDPLPLTLRWKRALLEGAALELGALRPAREPPVEETPDPPSADVEEALPIDAHVATLALRDSTLRWSDEKSGLDFELEIPGLELGGAGLARAARSAEPRWALERATASDWTLDVTPRDGGEGDAYALRASTGAVAQGGRIPFELELGRRGGVQLAATGELRPDPLEASVELSFRELRTARLARLVDLGGVRVMDGVSSGSAQLSFEGAPGRERGLRARGELEHRGLAVEIEAGDLVRVEAARIVAVVEELVVPMSEPRAADGPAPVSLHLGRFEVARPSLELTLAAPGAGGEEPGDAEPVSPAFEIAVDGLALRDGRATLRDRGLGPAHEQHFDAIEIEASGLHWPPLRFESAFAEVGSLGGDPLRVEGSWQPGRIDLLARGGQIALAPWNPLVEHYSDYGVTGGRLSLRGELRLRAERYEAPVHLTANNLEISARGSAFQRQFGLPLNVAVTLLRDTAGNIRLSLPVSGDLKHGSELDLAAVMGGAMREAISNALEQAAAAPIDLVGAVFRRVGEVFVAGVGEVRFVAGAFALSLDDEMTLGSAGLLVTRNPRAWLVLRPELVSDDLIALGEGSGPSDLLGRALLFGRAIFGGGGRVDPVEYPRVAELSKQRTDAMARFLRDESGVPPERIVVEPWDGKVHEGQPRVLLRLRARAR